MPACVCTDQMSCQQASLFWAMLNQDGVASCTSTYAMLQSWKQRMSLCIRDWHVMLNIVILQGIVQGAALQLPEHHSGRNLLFSHSNDFCLSIVSILTSSPATFGSIFTQMDTTDTKTHAQPGNQNQHTTPTDSIDKQQQHNSSLFTPGSQVEAAAASRLGNT